MVLARAETKAWLSAHFQPNYKKDMNGKVYTFNFELIKKRLKTHLSIQLH